MSHSAYQGTPERPSAPCPTCTLGGGFHDAQIHAAIVIDPKHFKTKDWQKNDAKSPSDAAKTRTRTS